MRIVHINVNDSGGAFYAAYRLHRELLRLGHQAVMFVGQRRNEGDPTVAVFHPARDLVSRVRRRLRYAQIGWDFARYRRSRPAGYEGFNDDRSPHGTDVLAQLPACDVINVHSMFRFLDYRAFFASVPRRTPVVRTLHDMSFFTGGCHIDAGCGRYALGCGACPQLGSNDAQDLSRRIWLRKYAALKDVDPDRLFLVTPSLWLAHAAGRSPLLKNFSVTVIPHGVDTEVFCPRDRAFAREVLGIAQNARVVLFVGQPVQRPIKRFFLLAQALNEMRDAAGLFLLTVGGGKPDVQVRVPHFHLGYVQGERLLSVVYSAADVLVVPSLNENFPLVTLEGLACGVPVVGTAVGGIAEIVRHGITGLLVPPDDVAALRAAIQELLDDPVRRAEMAANCRQAALEEYSVRVQAQRYLDLYARVLANGGSRAGWEADQPLQGTQTVGAVSPDPPASPSKEAV